jgi:hypothetical protein
MSPRATNVERVVDIGEKYPRANIVEEVFNMDEVH